MLDETIIPEVQGIYLFYLPKKDIYYLGETINLRQRLRDHLGYNGNKIISQYAKENNDLEFRILEFTDNFSTRKRRFLESQFIRDYRNKGFNLLNKESKTDLVDNFYGNESRPVLQFTLEGIFVRQYASVSEAGKELSYHPTGISNAATGTFLSAYKHLWVYKDNFSKELLQEKIETYKLRKLAKQQSCGNTARLFRAKKISQFSKSGEFIKTWDSTMDVQRSIGINQGNISNCASGKLKSTGGYIWKYAEE